MMRFLPTLVPTIACLVFQSLPFLATSMAQVTAAKTVHLDGKSLYIPEIQITQKADSSTSSFPISSFLYVSSWAIRGKANMNHNPLCSLDPRNNSVRIESTDKLLTNSEPRILTAGTVDAFLDSIPWSRRNAIHFAVNLISDSPQPVIIELCAESDSTLFNNGKPASRVFAVRAVDSGGRAYLPVMLDNGSNQINIKLHSIGRPRIQAIVHTGQAHVLKAAWQSHGGLLKYRVHMTRERSNVPEIVWNPSLGNASISMEVRDVSTGKTVLQKTPVRRGNLLDNSDHMLPPGVYEAVYRVQDDSASEFFIVGDPSDMLASLQDNLSKYNPDSKTKLDIDAQIYRARILLEKDNYNFSSKKWQEKLTFTLASLAAIERRLKEGAASKAKHQPGLHLLSFTSAVDGSTQHYRLYIPAVADPASVSQTAKGSAGVPPADEGRHDPRPLQNRESKIVSSVSDSLPNSLPLLVIAPTRIANRTRPFIESPIMANHRQALLWAKHAEKHGFALLWPGYRAVPEGYTYESAHMNEALQAAENQCAIDKHRISIHATCAAGYTAGRLATEYPNRFAAIVYDRAVFDLSLDKVQSVPELVDWYDTINPSRHVIANKNLKIFAMHDDTKPAGHGPMELTVKFLDRAKAAGKDVVSHISNQPMTTAERMDMIFTWLSPCVNKTPDATRSDFLAQAGHTGPIMEIFSAPAIIVAPSRALDDVGRKNMQRLVESLAAAYRQHFHGAECVIKTDDEVTQDDIINNNLILIGDPQSNSVWEKLQSRIHITVTPEKVLYKNNALAGNNAFAAITHHPDAAGRHILLLGAADWKSPWPGRPASLLTAWYDCIIFASPGKIITRLDALDSSETANNRRQ